jgi:transposase-like protein
MSDTELLPKSEPEPVHRLEVFAGTGRRRAWTAQQKARIIAESYESRETVSTVACRHGLTPQQLFGWRRNAREDEAGDSGLAFAPMVVDPPRPCSDVPISRSKRADRLKMDTRSAPAPRCGWRNRHHACSR